VGFLEPLLPHLERPGCFAVSPVNLDEEGRLLSPHQICFEIRRGQIRLQGGDLESAWRNRETAAEPVYTFFASGGSMLVRRDAFLALGGFADAFLPYYYEDVDLGWRAWRRGRWIALEPRSLVTHRRGGSIQATQKPFAVRVIRKRNRFLLVWRNLLEPRWFYFSHLGWLPIHLLGTMLRADPSVLLGFLAALARVRGIRRHRREERRSQVVTDRQVQASMGVHWRDDRARWPVGEG
jgi:GT2 family glycosyltransferase